MCWGLAAAQGCPARGPQHSVHGTPRRMDSACRCLPLPSPQYCFEPHTQAVNLSSNFLELPASSSSSGTSSSTSATGTSTEQQEAAAGQAEAAGPGPLLLSQGPSPALPQLRVLVLNDCRVSWAQVGDFCRRFVCSWVCARGKEHRARVLGALGPGLRWVTGL